MHHHYTEQEDAWLVVNVACVEKYAQLTEMFNAEFGADVSAEAIRTRFKQKKWKGIGVSCTCYKFGHKLAELPLGTIRKSQTGTYIKVLACAEPMSGYKQPYWLPLQQKIYEDAYGKIKPGYMVCHLNNNPDDNRIENLYPIDRKISVVLSTNKWWNSNPEITMTAIRWCEMYYAIQEVYK